jgi:hypothetical protein
VELYNFIVAFIALLVGAGVLYYTRESVLLMRSSMSARRRAAASATPWWRTWQVLAIAVLVALTWVPWVYGLIRPTETEALFGYTYGTLPTGDDYILGDLVDTKPDKKIIGAVLHYNGGRTSKTLGVCKKVSPMTTSRAA